MKFPIARTTAARLLTRAAWTATLSAALALVPAHDVQAGVLRILEVEDASTATFKITFASGGTKSFKATDGGANDADDNSRGLGNGNIKVILGDESFEKTIKSIDVEWTHYDRHRGSSTRTRTINKLTPDTGTVITSLEPFEEPGFVAEGADVPLLVVLDAAAFVDAGIVFGIDALFDVLDGVMAGFDFLRVKDLSGVPPGTELSDAEIDALPSYTGQVRAVNALRFDPLPAAPTWCLLAVAVFGVRQGRSRATVAMRATAN